MKIRQKTTRLRLNSSFVGTKFLTRFVPEMARFCSHMGLFMLEEKENNIQDENLLFLEPVNMEIDPVTHFPPFIFLGKQKYNLDIGS